LNATSPRENVTVKIPRSFRGSITAGTKYGRIQMSEGVSSQASVFSDLLGVKRLSLGDINAGNDQAYDAMVLNSEHGCIRISFEDEGVEYAIRMPKLFSRLFG
jgi:hypothetical protein